jgi:phosphatidylserine/phosphatidylglycerophosphate/cardiolipin synthase-like enzyme
MGNTAATMHSLVTSTTSQLLLVGYALHGGKQVFKTLAERMDHDPALDVTFCLDIQRGRGDERQADELVAAFKKRFINDQWSGNRLPKVYYDPRSLCQGAERACLHAKVVVVDQMVTLITSANFTEAAQERNIELGALLRDHRIAQRIHQHFHFLIDRQKLLPVIE